tara:strand:+ start:246 stop:494 length:249 start_codon:yes stop_codon:yes gene_type:complete
MNCPKCDSRSTYVIETRPDLNGEKRRRRECQDCKWRFTTYEVHSYNLLDDDKIKKHKEGLMKSLVDAESLLEKIKAQALLIL